MQFNATKYYVPLLCCLAFTYSLSAKDAILTGVQRNYVHASLGFIQNVGQVTDQYHNVRTDVQFSLKRNGVSLFLSAGVLHYQFKYISTKHKKKLDKAYRMDVTLLGANTHAEVLTTDMQEYTEQYNISGKTVIAKSFDRVTYIDVYPGIDWALYIKGDKVEYDFIVHPGANASQIQLKYGGATAVRLSDNGKLTVKTPAGEIEEKAPYTYTQGTKKAVTSSFSLNGNLLSFNVAPHQGTIVIDPQLQWSTYFGGIGNDQLLAVATDNAGSVYACGSTTSASNIATSGAYENILNVGPDGVLLKFTATGTLAWATYLGNSGGTLALGLTVDKAGNVYVTGSTTAATGITAGNTYQNYYAGGGAGNVGGDVFLEKFNSAGAILWGTYYGGTGVDVPSAVVCDRGRSVYITGFTTSATGIASAGAHSTTFNGVDNAFVARFDTSGNFIWGTYYGQDTLTTTIACSISADPAGSVYIAGRTNSPTNISFGNAHQSTISGNSYNAFMAKFDSAGVLRWGTYFGGYYTYGYAVANDTLGNVYSNGYTGSSTLIASPGTYQPTYLGGGAGYLCKFDTAGNFIWGTYFGAPVSLVQQGIAIDNFGNPVISGSTISKTNIATINNGSYQSVFGGNEDGYVIKFTPLGQRLWGTYLGGAGSEQQQCVASNANGKLYVAGFTQSTNAIATAGAYQAVNNGSNDGYVTTFNKDTFVVINQPYTDTLMCIGGSFGIAYSTSYPFIAGNVFIAQISDSSGSFAAPINIGSATATATGTIAVTIPANTIAGIRYRIRIIASSPAFTSPDEYFNIHITAQIGPPQVGINVSPSNIAVQGTLLEFTSSVVSASPYVSYQWFVNGHAVPNDTLASASFSTLADSDVVTVVINNHILCAAPDSAISNAIRVRITTGVSKIVAALNTLNLYPNPNNGLMSLTGQLNGLTSKTIQVEILNAVGQLVYNHTALVSNGTINEPIQIGENVTAGTYLMRIEADGESRVIRFTVRK